MVINLSSDLIGKEIRKLRELSGLSVNELGRRSGVSSAGISRIENGIRKNPTLDVLTKLSKCLNVNAAYLLSFVDEQVSIIELNPKEKEVIREMKKRRGFFEDLSVDTEKKLDKLYRMWKLMNEE